MHAMETPSKPDHTPPKSNPMETPSRQQEGHESSIEEKKPEKAPSPIQRVVGSLKGVCI